MALTGPWPDDDDTDLDYYDTPTGNIWRPDTQPRDETPVPGSAQPGAAPAIARQRAVNQEPTARTGPPMIIQQARRCPSCQQEFGSRRDLTRHQREAHSSARPHVLIRLARALRAVHQELELASECLLRIRQPPEADPLIWVRTPVGYRLAGYYLPPSRGGSPATVPDP